MRPEALQPFVARSVPEVESIRADWDALRREASRGPPSAGCEQFIPVIVAMGSGVQPHVVLLRDAYAPRGAIVGRVSRRPVLCRIGYQGIRTPRLACLDVEYGGLIARRGDEVAEHAMLAYLGSALEVGGIDHILIDRLAVTDALFERITDAFGTGCIRKREPHWVCEFDDTSFDATMSRFSKQKRKNMTQHDRQLTEHCGGNVELRVLCRDDDLDEYFREAMSIAGQTYQHQLGVGFRDDPVWRALLHTEAAAGRLRCYLLRCRGISVVFEVATVVDRTCYLLATGYLPDLGRFSPGTVMLYRVFRDLWALGVRAVDYGFGDAEYKKSYSTKCREEAIIHLYARRFRPQVARAIDVSTTGISRMAQAGLRTAGLVQRVRKRWRSRLEGPSDR